MTDYNIKYLTDDSTPLQISFDSFMDISEETSTSFPKYLSMDNFCGYYAYCGNSLNNVEYIVVNDGYSLLAYKTRSSGGFRDNFAGIVNGEELFLEELTSVPHTMNLYINANGGYNSFGYLFFKQSGRVTVLHTTNIFGDER